MNYKRSSARLEPRKKLRNKRLKKDFRMIERMTVAFHRVYKG